MQYELAVAEIRECSNRTHSTLKTIAEGAIFPQQKGSYNGNDNGSIVPSFNPAHG